MGVQDLTVQMVVIVVIGVFFASFMDAIAGGGGIISVPTYLLAGLLALLLLRALCDWGREAYRIYASPEVSSE